MLAIFDILGYKEFLKNNEPDEAGVMVVDTIANLKNLIPDHLRNLASTEEFRGSIDGFLGSVTWVIFSDTILLVCPFVQDDDESKRHRWAFFLALSLTVTRYMFEFGLPVRGVLHAGRVYVKNHCFSGKAILDAYELKNDLLMAACVLTNEAYEELKMLTESLEPSAMKVLLRGTIVEYPVPRHNAIKERIPVAYFLAVPSPESKQWLGDKRQSVVGAFRSHNKDMSAQDVRIKLENTIKYLEYMENLYSRIHNLR